MKTLENKETEFKNKDESPQGFFDLAIVCLNQIPQGGLGPTEMARRIKVINKIEDVEVGKKVKLEDADFEVLKDCTDSTKWSMIHKDIVAFTDYIKKFE